MDDEVAAIWLTHGLQRRKQCVIDVTEKNVAFLVYLARVSVIENASHTGIVLVTVSTMKGCVFSVVKTESRGRLSNRKLFVKAGDYVILIDIVLGGIKHSRKAFTLTLSIIC